MIRFWTLPEERSFAKDFLLIVLFDLVLFGARLPHKSLWILDEARVAEGAREMGLGGNLLVPTVNGVPEDSYPPLIYWLLLPPFWIFGKMTPVMATLPSILAGIGFVLLTYRLGRFLWDRKTGLFAALILSTMSGCVGPATLCRPDMAMSFFEAAALFLFARWYLGGDRGPASFPAMLFYPAIAFGVLAKGPQALIVTWAIILGCLLFRKDLRLISRMRPFLGLLIVLGMALPWYLYAQLSSGTDFLLRENLDGFLGPLRAGGHARRPLFHYVPIFLARTFPWVVFLASAILILRREARDDPAGQGRVAKGGVLLGAWILFVFAFYSLAASKRYYYITLLYPAVALLVARFFTSPVREMASALHSLIPWGLLALLTIGADPALSLAGRSIRNLDLSPYRTTLHGLAAAGALVSCTCLVLAWKRKDRWVVPLLAATLLGGYVTYFFTFEKEKCRREGEVAERFLQKARPALTPEAALFLYKYEAPYFPLHLGGSWRRVGDPGALKEALARERPVIVGIDESQLGCGELAFARHLLILREGLPYGNGTVVFLFYPVPSK